MNRELAWDFMTAFFRCMKENRPQLHMTISMKQFMLLTMIAMYEIENQRQITVSELAEKLLVSRSAVSQMINIMQEKGYLQRTAQDSDRRIVSVAITEKGRQEMEAVRLQCVNTTAARLEKMGEEKMRLLISLLNEFCAT